MNAITTIHRPGLLGNNTVSNLFENLFSDFPRHLEDSTSGYPVADIYTAEDGSTVLEFALAGFDRNELAIDVKPDKRSITVTGTSANEGDNKVRRRIARRNFTRTYVNYDDNLDLSSSQAQFENGLLTIRVPQRPEIQPLSINIE